MYVYGVCVYDMCLMCMSLIHMSVAFMSLVYMSMIPFIRTMSHKLLTITDHPVTPLLINNKRKPSTVTNHTSLSDSEAGSLVNGENHNTTDTDSSESILTAPIMMFEVNSVSRIISFMLL